MRRRSVSRPMSRLRRAVLAGTALVCALVLGCTGLFAAWLAGVRMPIASGATYLRVEKISPLTGANRIAGAPSAPFFILLVGNDFRPGVTGSRGDALHLLGVNPKLKQASMLNIPRDTCWQGDKINAANTRGARASADAVSGLIGVPVSYVVQVNFDGLVLPVHELRLQVRGWEATAMDPLVPLTEPKEPITVTPAEIIYHRRVRVMEHAAKTSVSEACRVFGVSRTTFYRWQKRVEAYGLDALMPKGRRAPAMPNQTPSWVVEELLAEAVVRPTLGARRYAEVLAERGFQLSASGVQKILNRHGLGRRRQRVGASRSSPPRPAVW